MTRTLRYFAFGIVSLLLTGFNDTVISSVPDSYVNLQLNLTTTYPTFRNNPYSYLLFEKPILVTDAVGYGGILVYCGVESYFAYDLCCPYEHKRKIKIRPNSDSKLEFKFTCDSCKTIYDVSSGFGYPVSGPSKEALRRYKAVLNGDILYISR